MSSILLLRSRLEDHHQPDVVGIGERLELPERKEWSEEVLYRPQTQY